MFIALIAASIVIIGIIGYKIFASSIPSQRTDAAAQETYAGMAKARADKLASRNEILPAQRQQRHFHP